MTVYNINLGIGWASSGVEYAQAYRAKILRNTNENAKFIFMDLILADNIAHLTQNMGFRHSEIIWLYQFFSDIPIHPTTMTVEEVLSGVVGTPEYSEKLSDRVVRYFYPETDSFVTCYFVRNSNQLVEHAEFVSRGKLLRKDYYSTKRYLSEFFVPKNGVAVCYNRTIYNSDGTTAYEILIENGEEVLFRFKNHVSYGRTEFIAYFLEQLQFTTEDIIILDRETDIGPIVFERAVRDGAKLGVVVHAEHFSDAIQTDDYLLWNNFYDYQFTNADKVDFFIVSTQAQKDVLAAQFAKYTPHNPKIIVLPVGSIDCLKMSDYRKPFSLMTASRLAGEKHVDWLVRGVALAHEVIPDLTFDIYGSGGEEGKIRETIEKYHAGEYIHLMGHCDLTDVYQQYEVYLTASTSEGFGLTLLEAIGSGLVMIGFDVPYGNQTFINNEENGYLIPLSKHRVEDVIAKSFSEEIIRLYHTNALSYMRNESYHLAEDFLTKNLVEKWKKLLIEEIAK